jgi:hypothetical protein
MRLPEILKETLDLLLFGCATGLRYSDLEAIEAISKFNLANLLIQYFKVLSNCVFW